MTERHHRSSQQVITHTKTLHKSRRFNPFGVNPEMYLVDSAGTHSTRVEPGGLSYYSMKEPRYLVMHNSLYWSL